MSEPSPPEELEPRLPAENLPNSNGYGLRPKKLRAKDKPCAKTKAEIQAAYRARLKADPDRWAEYQEKQKECLRDWRANLTPERKAINREKNRIRSKNARSKTAVAPKKTGSDAVAPRSTRATTLSDSMSLSGRREYWSDKQRERRAKLSEEEKEAIRAKSRQRYLEKKQRLNPQTAMSTQTEDVSACPEVSTPSKQGQYNALYRVPKAMPKNSKAVAHVLKELVSSASPNKKAMLSELLCGETSCTKNPPQHARRRKVNDSLAKVKVVEFYLENSVDLPGKRQFSKRLKLQKKILTNPITYLFRRFMKENVDVKLSKRNFFRCRPPHVMLMKSQKFIQCLCELCENARLKLKALMSCGAQFQTVRDVIAVTVCDSPFGWWMPLCVSRKCNTCGVHLLKACFSDNVK